ncbi:hypothetical protein ABGB19_04090 [Mycobacterium sp. B14F4]|uniref:hypothetical protein n=1 Tax=Mycobacterium sp. B14F4 TaxID=3153565 RepID=UPI00325F1D89
MSGLKIFAALVIALAGGMAGSATVDPAIACAAPNQEWDIGAYDRCMKAVEDAWLNGELNGPVGDAQRECCEKTGGVWSPSPGAPPASGAGSCAAPPANAAQGPMAPPGSVATQTLEPEPPPVVRNPGVIQTFTPAPVG